MWPAIIAAGGTIASGILGNDAAERRQEDAQAFSAQQYATRYQTAVKDIQAAGLNPMLAYSQGPGQAPSSSAASATNFPDIGASYLAAKMNSAQVANVEADTENKKAQAALIEAQAAQAWSSSRQADANVGQIGAMTDKLRAEIENVPRTGDVLEMQARQLKAAAVKLYEESNTLYQKGLSEIEVRNQLRASVAKLASETDLLKLDKEAADKFDNFGREAGQLRPFFDILKGFIRRAH